MMFSLFVCPMLLSATLLSGAPPQSSPDDAAVLAEGRRLVAALSLDQADDHARFRTIGVERAVKLLMAVMNHGQRPEATRDDWAAMHRAVDGLIGLYAAEGDYMRAAVFTTVQTTLYRNYDQDLPRALDAARRGLPLKELAGQASTHIEHGGIGELLLKLGRPEEALVSLRRARDVHPDPHSTHAAMHWRDIIQAELARRDIPAARREAEAFARLTEAAIPFLRASARLAAADIDVAERKFEAALDHVQAARALARTGERADEIELEATATVMGVVFEATRALPYDQALALAGRIDREFRGLYIEITPFARLAIRSRRRLSGEFDAIIREDVEALERARAARSAGGQIEALRSLAGTYAALNSDTQVAALLQEALTLARATAPASGPPNPVYTREIFSLANALAGTYVVLGQLDEARTTYEESIKAMSAYAEAALRRQLASTLADAIVGLARVTARQGNPAAAIVTLNEALTGRPAHAAFNRAEVLIELARLERDTSPTLAVEHEEEAIALMVQQRDRRTEILRRLQLAEFLATHAAAGADRLDRARRHVAIVKQDAQQMNYSDAAWRVSYIEGLIAEAAGRQPGAIESYAAAVERLDQIRAGLSRQEQRASFLDSDIVQDLYRRLIRLHTSAGHRGEAWAFLERAKARTFLEMLQGRQFSSAEAVPADDELRELERQIIDLRVSLAPEAQSLRGAQREPGLVLRELKGLEQKFALARQQASVSRSRATQPLAIQPISLAETQKRLPARAVLIEYALLGDAITAFVVSRSAVEQITWAADVGAVRADVQTLRTLMSDLTAGGDMAVLSRRLSAALLGKVVARIPAGTEHLIVVSSEFLSYLPFEVLPLGDGKHLLDKYSISYLPSASTIQFLSSTAGTSGDDIFLGVLGNASVEDWPPLPGTIAETDGILKLFPKATRVVEGTFTRASALDALRRYDWVHFATHGLLDEQAPIFSAVLMGTNKQGSTRLSLYEIAEVPLKARLVVLSACETGLGQQLRGDEVTGLTRTFLQAGASAVVSSLWKVDDAATAFLMEAFYKGIRDGLRPSRALRNAALATRTRFPEPFFWAPFVLTGIE